MKYRPRHSNFEEQQDQVVQNIVADVEHIKDTVAKIIDEYVDAIIAEHLAERELILMQKEVAGQWQLHAWYQLGSVTDKDGIEDVAGVSASFETLLEELDHNRLDETPELLEEVAGQFMALAKKWREGGPRKPRWAVQVVKMTT